MNGSIFAIEARGSGAHRAPLSRAARIRRFAAGVVIAAMAMLGLQASPAWAAAAGDISKALDATQGQGYSLVNGEDTFQTGALVRYRLVVSCSSLDTACVTGTVTDVLDPNLEFVQVIAPVARNNDGQVMPIVTSTSGQTVTTVVGSAAAPLQGGNTIELVLVARVVSRPASGVIPNQATITVPGVAPVPSEIVTIHVPPPSPNYRITKQVISTQQDAALGEPVTYRVAFEGFQYDNVGIVLPFTITDTYPAGATVVNPAGGTVDAANHTITWTITSINQVTSPVTGQCAYTFWCTVWTQDITLSYPAPTFSAGQTVNNTIATDPTYLSGDLPTLTATAPKKLAAAAPAATVAKTGPGQASAGNTITYTLEGKNSGNSTLTDFTVTDTIPTGVTSYKIVRGAYYQPLYPATLGPVTFEAFVNGAWTSIGNYSTTGTMTPGFTITLPAGATQWRMTAPSLPAGGTMSMYATATLPDDAAAGTVFTNCAAVSTSTTGTSIGGQACVDTTVVEPFVGLMPYKAHKFLDAAQTSVVPGETFLWGIGVKATGPNLLTSVDFADQLPAQFEYVTTRCFGGNGDGNGDQTSLNHTIAGYGQYGSVGCDKPAVPQPSSLVVNADGTTSLAWQDVPISGGQATTLWGSGQVWWIVIEVRVKPGTAVANYTNQMAVGTGDSTSLVTKCAGVDGPIPYYTAFAPLSPDTADWDKDQNTAETLCRYDDSVQVRLAAAADTTKWDKGPLPNALLSTGTVDPTCPDWGGFTRYPCVAQTNPGGDFDYKFNIQNTGNMTLTNYVGYDILPYVGDTGVSQILTAQSRATEWTPVLTGPISIVSQPAAAGTQILYNLTSNPCRPEVAQGPVDTTWQATCDDTWFKAAKISDWSTVKSFKVVAFQDGAVWNGAEQIILDAPMMAPLNAPDSTKDPLDLSIAWNSIAHREFKINADGTTARLLAAEPLKVGIIVPFKGVSVGDYVWYDANRDGLQSPNEDPIADVLVQLKDASGNIVQETTTDANGYYSFQYLTPGAQYTIVFTAPADPADATKLLVFTTANASGVTSNDPTADNGTSPLDGTTGGDSDAIPAADGLTGSVTFTAPLTGSNAISDKTAGTKADNPGLDAGFMPDAVPVSIGDYVWLDNNRDGLQTAGEPGVAGVTVTLKDSTGTVVGTPYVTLADGYYWFTGLTGGADYTLTFTRPDGYSWTTQNVTGVTDNNLTTDKADSDVNPTDGTIAFTAPASGTNAPGAPDLTDNPTLDGGLVQLNLQLQKSGGTWTGLLVPGTEVTWTLTPNNAGPSDSLAGWTVTDVIPSGLQIVSMGGTNYTCDIATTPTAPSCTSSVPLLAGTTAAPITVVTKVATGWTGSSFHNVAYISPATGEATETNALVIPTTSTITSTSTTDNDAEASLNVVSVGDFVWVDANRNGLQDSGEVPVVGATVTLYAADGTTVLGTATTNASGYYWFTGLTPLTAYVIGFDISTATSPAGATAFFTTPNAGGVTSNSATADLTDSDAVPATATAQQATVSFTSQATGTNLGAANVADNPGIDAGIVVYNLKLAKALTSVAPFVPGQTVTYTLTPHNDGPAAALAEWSVTDILPADLTLVSMSGGAGYTCTGNTCVAVAPLAAGTDGPVITVTATLSSTFSGVAKNVAYVSPAGTDGPETNALVTPTLATDTTTSGTDNDAQATLEVKKVSVGDFVWVDVNRNGLQDAGEAPVVGATVTLYAADGTTVIGTPVLTDATGHYWFTDLLPGTAYVIGFDISTATSPAGATAFFTTPNAGGVTNNSATADLTDSDAVPATATAQQAKVSFTSQGTGSNLGAADVADNPGIDAGIVVYNLKLAKTLDTAGPYYPGQTVTYTLTPSNDGPADALAGWSVTDLLPTGLTFVSMTGDAAKYSCSANVCTSLVPLAKGSGAPITVTAKIDATFTGSANNVAYVAPAGPDGPETVPLGTPVTKDGNTDGGTDNDAQAPLEVKKVSIGDYVWWDINRDGLQGDPTVEPPIAGMTVNLLDAAGNPVLVGGVAVTTVTDANGYYAFTDLLPNTAYTVVFVKSSLAATADASFTKLGGGDLALDSNANPADGTAAVTTPITGNNLGGATMADDPKIDAGLVKYNLTLAKTLVTAGPYYPGLTVTYTLIPSNDGPADAVAGWSVTDVLPTGMTFVSMTGDSGAYTCTANVCTSLVALPKGAGAPITVTATIDAGFIGKANNVAYVSPSGTDVPETNPLGEPVVKDGDTDATPTDNDDQQSLEVLPVSIGDYVWYDRNRDGQQGAPADEPVVPGVVVNLLDAAGNPVLVGGVAVTTVTDANGYYAFTGLAPHTAYIVEFVKPADTVFTTPLTGDTATDSNADVVTGQATVTTKDTGSNSAEPGMADDPTIDAGLVELVSIGDYVWFDRDRDGLQGAVADEPVVAGVTVNLLDAEGNPAVLAGGAPVTTVTDANGFYSFTNLLAGVTYVVEFVKPADTIFTTQDVSANAADTTDSDADVVTGKVTVVAPVTGANSATTPDDPTIDAGLVELVSVGDFVWWDTNRDGLQSEGELPVAGVTVNLLDVDGNPAVLPGGAPVSTVTDANGFYSFNNLIGGVDYVVQFVKPENTTFTWMLEGEDSTVDSDADVDGLVPFTAPLSGDNSLETPDDPTLDAGLVKLVSVGDYVWYDVNRDGIQGEGEAPVPGVTVNLYDEETGELLATAVTDENGFYSFTDLWAGATYTVEFVKPAGTSFTSMDSGADDALDSDADLVTGMVTFVAPEDGLNSAVTPDDPTIDAGLVKFNLTLTKVLSTTGVVYPGDTVTFTLTPHNAGPVDALAGWSVTEVVPAGLTFVSMTGDGYTCTGTTCVAVGVLAAGADGNPITVTMTAGTAVSSRNIAFVDKAPTDGPETNPLVTPTSDTDTSTSETDNDSEAAVIVSPRLPDTGTDVAPFLALALGLMAAGGLLLAATRRRRRTSEQ